MLWDCQYNTKMKRNFSQLDNNTQIELCTTPQCVFVTQNPNEETRDQVVLRQEKFLSLPEKYQDKLLSEKTSQQIQRFGGLFNLKLLQLASISRAIRSFYFGELKLEDFPFYLAKEIPVDLSTAKEITTIVMRDIINDDSEEKLRQQNMLSLPLMQALEEIPEIGEQLITSERINVLNLPEPARPSVKNWIADYTSVLGRDTHDAIVRGNYIFHGANAKKLNDAERQKLAYILKALDEKTPININKAIRKIIFPSVSQSSQPSPRTSMPEKSMAQNQSNEHFRFSSPQKLGYENPKPYRTSLANAKTRQNSTDQDTRGLVRNVVNLRDK